MFTCTECKKPIDDDAYTYFDESGEWHLECWENWLDSEMAYWASNYAKRVSSSGDDAYENGSYKREDTMERIFDAADSR